jgi:glycosyltransferase involved in cell wall biosynthesis
LKVVHVCPRFYPYQGGVETVVREFSKRLIQMGVNVEVYTTDPKGDLPKEDSVDGIQIQRFRSHSFNGVYHFSPKLFSALKDLKEVDLVHAHDYQDYCILAASRAKKRFQKPLVYSTHYHPIGGSKTRTVAKRIYNALLGGRLMKNADAVIAVSESEKALLEKLFHLDEKRIRHIPNGIDTERLRDLQNIENRKRGQTLLYVGRLERYKGVQHIIKALPKIVEARDCELQVVGEGSYKEELVSFAKKMKMTEHVSFLGKLSEAEITEAYLGSDIFIMPSQYEAFCVSLAEAMAYALPVIATKVGGMTELFEDGKHGFLIDYPPERDLLAEQAIYLLENRGVSRKMGREGREYILSRFSWKSSTEQLLELYKELLT